MARKVVVIGLDCAPPKLIFGAYRAVMPNLSALMSAGSWGPLRTCMPPITVPAWAAMMTGRDPGELGLYGFRNREELGYGQRMARSGDVRVPWLWERLAAAGKQVAALFVPPTYPPEPAGRNTLVSCLLTPGADRPHTCPPGLGDELAARFGPYIPDVDDVRREDRSQVLAQIRAMTEQHFAIARHVIREQRPDFMAMVELGPDRLHHAFWHDLDPDHPAHDPEGPFRTVGLDYYAFIDRQLGALLELLDDETTVMVVSDHGARPMLGGICLNEWLIEHGYLVLAATPDGPTPAAELAIDWRRTRAFAEGGYYGRVFLNVEGREPQGCIPQARYAAEREALLELLGAIRGPAGERLEHRLVTPEQAFRAQRGRPPDILAFLGDLDYRALGSVGHGRVHLAHNDTGPDPCNHDWDGIFIMSGGGTRARGPVTGYQLYDVNATVLGLLNVPHEADLLGTHRAVDA
jgi:predicted AlkP superfamily phosphohydrolase/phosphomutase